MGDVNGGELEFLLKIADQRDDLRLDRNVQSGRRFVADEDLRVAGERDRDDDTLTHAAGILERVLVEAVGGVLDADALHELDGLLLRLGAGNALVLFNDLGDLRADRADRVQGRHRVLEDRGDLRAADAFPVFVGLELGEILALEHDGAIRDGAVGFEHAGERLGENALAGAGLTDNGERLALVQVERDAADGREIIITDAEFDFNVLCGQNDISVICHYSAPLTYACADRQRRQASVPRCRGKWR